tara:strand:+ start:1121 stop:1312 length:192 start_codon:yes stop_codon:yes gene_type:complete
MFFFSFFFFLAILCICNNSNSNNIRKKSQKSDRQIIKDGLFPCENYEGVIDQISKETRSKKVD